jgi:hypothetical protein
MTNSAPTLVQSVYAPINDLQMYYEIHRPGDVPLLLLHSSVDSL